MSGRDKTAETQTRQLAAQQQANSEAQIKASNDRIAKMDAISAPTIDWYTKLASGDPNSINTALSVPLANLRKSQTATESQIFDSVPEGPLRDFMSMSAKRDANANVANLKNQAVVGAYDKLPGLAAPEGQIALQQLGAGSRFGEAAVSTNQGLMDQAQKRKAATLGMVGQMAALGGSIATGGMSGGASAAKAKTPKG